MKLYYWIFIHIAIILAVSYLKHNKEHAHIEGFGSKLLSKPLFSKAHAVELYNPSAYTGMYKRKFDVPDFYTRTNTTFPLYNKLGIIDKYNKKGKSYTDNITMAPWGDSTIFPLVNRRTMLV